MCNSRALIRTIGPFGEYKPQQIEWWETQRGYGEKDLFLTIFAMHLFDLPKVCAVLDDIIVKFQERANRS